MAKVTVQIQVYKKWAWWSTGKSQANLDFHIRETMSQRVQHHLLVRRSNYGDATSSLFFFQSSVFSNIGTCTGSFTSSFPIERGAKIGHNSWPNFGCISIQLHRLNTSPSRTLTQRAATWAERCVKTQTNYLCCCCPHRCSSQFSH